MFTPIKIEYLGEASRIGGRRTVEKTVDISCVWDDSIKYSMNERIRKNNIEVRCTLVFETVDDLNPDTNFVVYQGKRYQIIDCLPAPRDLGLTGTYDLYLRELKGKSDV